MLDFLVTGHVFKTANLSPGRITDIRCHFVRNETLAKACVHKGVHKFLQHMCPKLQCVLDSFIAYVQDDQGQDEDQDELDSSDESEEMNTSFMSTDSNNDFEIAEAPKNVLNCEEDVSFSDDVEVPKILGDLVESILGAVYLDSKLSLRRAWEVTTAFLPDLLTDDSFETVAIDSVRQLHEMGVMKDVKLIPPSKPGQMATAELFVSYMNVLD